MVTEFSVVSDKVNNFVLIELICFRFHVGNKNFPALLSDLSLGMLYAPRKYKSISHSIYKILNSSMIKNLLLVNFRLWNTQVSIKTWYSFHVRTFQHSHYFKISLVSFLSLWCILLAVYLLRSSTKRIQGATKCFCVVYIVLSDSLKPDDKNATSC